MTNDLNSIGRELGENWEKFGKKLEKVWKTLGIKFGENWDRFGKIYLNLDVKCDITEKFIENIKNFL